MHPHQSVLRSIGSCLCVLATLAPVTTSRGALAGGRNFLGDVSREEIRAAEPGHILRVWPQVGGALASAKAYRTLYRSTGLNGEPIAVSGAIIFPAGPPPRSGRNVIAWAHPTTGVVERCAPTLLPDLSETILGLTEMLARGYVIAATDYEGLGGAGMHPYLIGVSEARSVLDRCAPRASFPTRLSIPALPCGAILRAACSLVYG